MHQISNKVALGSGCLAALGWGLTGTFIKLLPEFTTLEVLSLRLVVALLAILPVLVLSPSLRSQSLTLAQTRSGLWLSSLMAFYYLFAVRAFQLAPVSDVVLVVGLSPLLGLAVKTARGRALLLRESAGATLAFAGLLLFVWPKLQGNFNQSAYLTGLFFALLSACITLAYASSFQYYTAQERALSPMAVGFITFLLGTVIVVPMSLVSSPTWVLNLGRQNAGWIGLGLGTVSTVVPTLCYSFAAKYLSPILTTALNLLTPIFAAVIAILLLKESFPVLSVIGASLILAGILWLSLPQPNRHP